MSQFKFISIFLALIVFGTMSLVCRDVILEFKGAYFLPTNDTFKDAYPGGALYGPELTVQLKEDRPWYAFFSLDYYKQDGKCLSVADSTTLRLVPLALGIKYLKTICDWADVYLGLGVQPIYVNKKSRRACVTARNTQWAFGGIGKVGTYIPLGHHFLLDLFFNYSFAKTRKNNFYGHTKPCSKANLSGAIFGAGLAYRF